MKKLVLCVFVLSLVVTSCNKTEKEANASGDSFFEKVSDDYIKGYLNWRPQNGVYLGLHEYDGKFPVYSKASLASELKRLKEFDAKLSEIDSASLSIKKYYDWKMLHSSIKNEIFSFEELKPYTKNPMTYAGAVDVNIYIKRNFAPIEQRIKSIIAIENKVPQFYEDAKANLQDTLAIPHTQLAIEIAKGSASFLEKDLLVALKEVKNESLMKEFKAANKKAIQESIEHNMGKQRDAFADTMYEVMHGHPRSKTKESDK